MTLSKTTRIVLIVAAAVLILGLASLEAFGDLDAGEYLGRLIDGASGLLVGLGIAGGRGREQ